MSTFAIADEDTVFFNENVLTGKNITDTIGRSGSPLARFFLNMDDTSLAASTPPVPELTMEGGTTYVRHLRTARGTAKGSYTGYDQLKTDPNRKYDKVHFELAQYYTMLPYSGDDLRKFRGQAEQVGKIAEDIQGQIGDLSELVIQGLFNAGAAQTTLTPRVGIVGDYQEKGYVGLQYFFSTTRTWGGLIDTGNAHWAPKINATVYTTVQLTDPANAAYLPNLIQAIIKSIFVDCGKKPTRIFCGSTLWWMLEGIIRAENKGFANVTLGTLGCDTLKIFGCEVYEDAFMETYVPHAMYFFTPQGFGGQRNLGICARQDAWFKVGGWKEAYNQDAKVRMIIAHPGLYIDQPRMQGALTALGD